MNNCTSCNSSNKHDISKSFDIDFDSWVANGKPNEKQIVVGTTSVALQSIGIDEKRIVWDTSKINRIQRDHLSMSDNIIRQVPNLIANPIIVMDSKTQVNRVTIYGEVYNDDGVPVMAVLELLPIGRRNKVSLDTIKVANAYDREGGMQAVQSIISSSNILYICPDKIRTDSWLSHNQLQLPFEITKYGSICKVSLFERDVNGNFSTNPHDYPMPQWKQKLQKMKLRETKDGMK